MHGSEMTASQTTARSEAVLCAHLSVALLQRHAHVPLYERARALLEELALEAPELRLRHSVEAGELPAAAPSGLKRDKAVHAVEGQGRRAKKGMRSCGIRRRERPGARQENKATTKTRSEKQRHTQTRVNTSKSARRACLRSGCS